jgi:hypothetical protein
VLVPGNPPLKQSLMDGRIKWLEWLLDTRFTPKERADYQRLFMQAWKTATPAEQRTMDQFMTKEAEQLGTKGLEERARDRQALLLNMVTVWQTSKYPGDRWLLQQHEALYAPGGRKNAILVKADPALTEAMVDLDRLTVEIVFDLALTEPQRTEYRRLMIEEWKGMNQAKKQERANILKTWEKAPTFRNYERNLQRAFVQSRLLDLFRKKDASERARWLVALYESAYKEGSARNPVLVDAEPPLTQALVDRYRDYLEPMLDLSISGGFTAEQRKVLQDHLAKGWKKMTGKDRKELLADLDTWFKAAAPAKPADAQAAINTLRPKLLARLSAARDDPLSRWLLELVTRERKKYELLSQLQRQVFQTQMQMARNIGPGGSWQYNAATGSYDRWVPDR